MFETANNLPTCVPQIRPRLQVVYVTISTVKGCDWTAPKVVIRCV
jgi:hypothetical protein